VSLEQYNKRWMICNYHTLLLDSKVDLELINNPVPKNKESDKGVYEILFPRDQSRYIGRSNRLYERFRDHFCRRSNSQENLQNRIDLAIKRNEKVFIMILDRDIKKERYWINKSKNVLNIFK